mgnify:FL=1
MRNRLVKKKHYCVAGILQTILVFRKLLVKKVDPITIGEKKMKKSLSGLVAGLCLVGLANFSNAATVQLTYTADNFVGAWWVNGMAQELGTNASDWTKQDTISLSLVDGTDYSIVWFLGNANGKTPSQNGTVPGADPAAFLAKITGDIVGGNIYTNDDGDWSAVLAPPPDNIDPQDFPNWTWDNIYVTSFGSYGVSPWSTKAGLSGFDANSEWIWKSGKDASIYLMTSFKTTGTSPVPEPATMILFGTGLAGLAAARRKKKAFLI